MDKHPPIYLQKLVGSFENYFNTHLNYNLKLAKSHFNPQIQKPSLTLQLHLNRPNASHKS